MIPENFILSEALVEGIRILQQSGLYAHIDIVCVDVKTLSHEGAVPALKAIKSSDIGRIDKTRTYMFFGGQATGDEGGTASYVILEVFPLKVLSPLTIPNDSEVKYLSWDYPAKS